MRSIAEAVTRPIHVDGKVWMEADLSQLTRYPSSAVKVGRPRSANKTSWRRCTIVPLTVPSLSTLTLPSDVVAILSSRPLSTLSSSQRTTMCMCSRCGQSTHPSCLSIHAVVVQSTPTLAIQRVLYSLSLFLSGRDGLLIAWAVARFSSLRCPFHSQPCGLACLPSCCRPL